MELKMKYNYSYFIYPYTIKESSYKKYIQRLMKNEKYVTKFFEKEKNLSIFNFFLPTVRDYMFNSFNFSKDNSTFNNTLRDNLFKNSPCTMFEYKIGQDAQAKTNDEDGIFFKIDKIELVCFETGICFLLMKANIEDTNRFADLLNFNVKFRSINSEVARYEEYRNIKIQTSTFDDIKSLSDLIKEITCSMQNAKKIDIDINRFLTYSYVCLDQEYWNDSRPFADIEKEFFKFANVLNSEFNSEFINDKLKIVSLGNYTKIGISKVGMNLLTSSINTVNYTNLPFEFENEYLYSYIFILHQKFYFAKLLDDFKSRIKEIRATKKFIDFTNDIWVHELTNNDNGSLIFRDTKEALELNARYETVKEQYDVVYKGFKMRDSEMINKLILVLLAASVITNIVNFVNLYRLK